jgi:hypothetical protein
MFLPQGFLDQGSRWRGTVSVKQYESRSVGPARCSTPIRAAQWWRSGTPLPFTGKPSWRAGRGASARARKKAKARSLPAPADDAAAEAVEHALAAAAADARPSDAPASHEDARPVPQLPSIESIVAESDVRAFLAPGVPPELTRAALRRAWSTRYRCNLHSRIVIKKKSAQ